MRGVVLLFLLSLWPGGKVDAINQEVLAHVVQEMRRFGLQGQYAMAVLLTQQQCTNNRGILEVGVEPYVVLEDLNDSSSYIGERLIAATPLNGDHAEYRLLSRYNGDHSLMDTLITAQHEGDCIVFFSTYSPCLEWCNDPDGRYNIIDFMDVFEGFVDRKAFVFSYVWDPSINLLRNRDGVTKPPRQQVLESFNRIETHLPVYRCVRNRCYHCADNTDPQTNQCLNGYT